MICKNCGEELQDSTLLICPHCGQDPAGEPAATGEDAPLSVPFRREYSKPVVARRPDPTHEGQPVVRGMSGCAWGVILLTLMACVSVASIAAGLGGIYQGLKERDSANQALAHGHYSRGMVHLEASEIELAEAEFEQAIRVSPNTSMDAYKELKQIRAQRRVQPTPTSAIIRQAGDDIMTQARVEYDAGNWEEAIVKLEQVQSLDTDFETDAVQNMLYTAYMKYGTQLLEDERPEEARRSFRGALEIRPGDADAAREQDLVADYLTGASYLGADWEEAIRAFTDLYRRDRDYLDVGWRLRDAHRSYGEILAEEEDWCGAATQYAKSLALEMDNKVKEAYDETGGQCETGPPPIEEPPAPLPKDTSPPAPTAEGEATTEPATTDEDARTAEPVTTEEETPTEEAATAEGVRPTEEIPEDQVSPPSPPPEEEKEDAPSEIPPPAGVLAYSTFDPDEVRRVYQIEVGKGTNPTIIAENASQPAFSQDGTKLAFLSWQSDINGLRVTDQGGRNGYNVTKFLEDGYPSWGPDGTQLALFSTRESDRRPRIYTTWADGMVDSVLLALGESPSWSSQGWIAYHGCDPTGGNCSIWKMAPNGKGQVPVTNHESDSVPAWSSDGNRLAFMSARDGNWEIYVVNDDGSQVTRLTDNSANDGLPTWSPDGNWIAFTSSRDGTWGLYLIPATGGEAQKLWDVPSVGREWMEQRLTWR